MNGKPWELCEGDPVELRLDQCTVTTVVTVIVRNRQRCLCVEMFRKIVTLASLYRDGWSVIPRQGNNAIRMPFL